MDRQNIKRSVVLLAFIVLIIFFLTGCGTQNDLVGTWIGEEGDTIEFFKDGTIMVNDRYFSASGTYSIVENNRVRIEMDGLFGIAGAQIFQYSVSGNQLNLEGAYYTKSR